MKKRILYSGKCFYEDHDDVLMETEREGNFIEFDLAGEEGDGDSIKYRIYTLDNLPDEFYANSRWENLKQIPKRYDY